MDQRLIKPAPDLPVAISVAMVGLFLLVSIVGPAHSAFMDTDSAGRMMGCIFTGRVTLCEMNILEHAGLWQNMFVALPRLGAVLPLIAIIVFLVGRISRFNKELLLDLLTTKPAACVVSLRERFSVAFFDPVRRALARGVLHSKIFEAPLT